jgi:hypothetical protein
MTTVGNFERRQHAMTAPVILICHGSTEAVRVARFPVDKPLDEFALKGVKALARVLP